MLLLWALRDCFGGALRHVRMEQRGESKFKRKREMSCCPHQQGLCLSRLDSHTRNPHFSLLLWGPHVLSTFHQSVLWACLESS